MNTQLQLDAIEGTAPLQSKPVIQPEVCPVRRLCLLATMRPEYRCGFEQAGTVDGCPKRRRLER